MAEDFTAICVELGQLLQQKSLLLATAESCTGGWVAQAVTSIAGSSTWFERGFVTYSNQAKQDMLGVKADALANYGAVSEQVAKQMAEGALARSRAGLSLAVTGIAGPDGGSENKPVGLVWFAWAGKSFAVKAAEQIFTGDRRAVREQSVAFILQKIINELKKQ